MAITKTGKKPAVRYKTLTAGDNVTVSSHTDLTTLSSQPVDRGSNILDRIPLPGDKTRTLEQWIEGALTETER